MIDTSLSQGRGWLLALVFTMAASPAAAQLAQQAFQVVAGRMGCAVTTLSRWSRAMQRVHNLFADLPTLTGGEFFEQLAACRGVRIERILSSDQPEAVLYDQEQDEWVCLLQGKARLWIAGDEVALQAGDHCLIPAHTPHRVLSTSREPPCLWLAVHIHPHKQ